MSLLLIVIALVVVPSLAYIRGEQEAREQLQIHGYVCGMPLLGFYLLAVFVSGCLSSVALFFGVVAYRALPLPRPKLRMAELALIAAPLVLALFVAVGLVITGE